MLVYWREEVGGLITGGYERNPKPFGLDGIPDDFKYKLLPPDWERFTPLMENAIHRVPSVEKAEIVQLLNGPEGFTPDGEFLLGPTDVQRLLGGVRLLRPRLGRGRRHRQGDGRVDHRGHPRVELLAARRATFRPALCEPVLHPEPDGRDPTRATTTSICRAKNGRRSATSGSSPAYGRERDLGAVFGEKFGWERPNWYAPHEAKADHGYQPRGWAGRALVSRRRL